MIDEFIWWQWGIFFYFYFLIAFAIGHKLYEISIRKDEDE